MIRKQNQYPLVGKLISVLFFGGMGLLVLLLLLEKGIGDILLIALNAVSLVSWAGTFLFCAWVGYRGQQITNLKAGISQKLKILLHNMRPFLIVPLLALICGVFLSVVHGIVDRYFIIVGNMLFVLPAAMVLTGFISSMLVGIFKRN